MRLVAFLIIVIFLPGIVAAAQNSLSGDQALDSYARPEGDVFQEDLSCKAINDALRRTWSSSRIQVVTYNAKPDGTLKPQFEQRVIGEHQYGKYAFSTKWQRLGRGSIDTIGQRGPFWSSCRLIGTERDGDLNELHYMGTWRDFPYEAAADVWITSVDGRFHRIRMHFPDDRWKFPFATALDVFSYNPAQIEVPDVDGR